MNTFTPFYILSGAVSDLNQHINRGRTDSLERALNVEGLATVQVNGCYKGKRERSVLVIDDTPYNDLCAGAVLRLAREYGQESVLAVDANRQACLMYCEGGFESIGQWRGVSEKVAVSCDAYTERAGHYYTVK